MRLIMLSAALLLIAGCDRQVSSNGQAAADANSAAPVKPQASKLDRSQAGKPAPDVSFVDGDGAETSLAAFSGKPVLLNLWATWCAPCIKELPTLDKLSASPGAPQVVALSQDMQPQSTVAAFMDERKIGLESYQDKEMAMSTALGVQTLPTTILYGSDGKEIWRYSGEMDWTSPQAAQMLTAAK
ncbi:TlpA family protein disulfide reductase [Sphingomonas sp. KRR8]|uniref:TlpA family protein disulfide reductase n=1 Tax=Sphingomonas sp. KRR8 TaxID=2942996 RepID=UPI00201FE5F6|nr:TlpA disulfide reductase family protein [Sphingomonas sp. KRR8]URD60294.1 TlpA family protein disulfide reductase [Sphingomonas sp. KRR8]